MAGLMDRLMRLVRANVNDLIDQAEDPEKMIDQILREMQESIVMARAQVASMIAQEKELELEAAETKKLAVEWGKKAERAVTAGKDDLAREALRRKRDNEENSAIYTEQLGVQTQAVAKLKDQLRQLEAKYQTTLGARDSLVARQRRARAQRQVAEAVVVVTPLDPSSELDRMERKIRSEEAHAMAALEVGEDGLARGLPPDDTHPHLAHLVQHRTQKGGWIERLAVFCLFDLAGEESRRAAEVPGELAARVRRDATFRLPSVIADLGDQRREVGCHCVDVAADREPVWCHARCHVLTPRGSSPHRVHQRPARSNVTNQNGGPSGDRTQDRRIKSPLLCQLS